MPSTSFFFLSLGFHPVIIHANSQLADQYGADVAKTIFKRTRSKSLRDTAPPSNTPPSSIPRYSRRKEVPLYPFKSKYSQQGSSPLYNAD